MPELLQKLGRRDILSLISAQRGAGAGAGEATPDRTSAPGPPEDLSEPPAEVPICRDKEIPDPRREGSLARGEAERHEEVAVEAMDVDLEADGRESREAEAAADVSVAAPGTSIAVCSDSEPRASADDAADMEVEAVSGDRQLLTWPGRGAKASLRPPSGIGLAALANGLRLEDGSSPASPPSPGALLQALAGVHPRWQLAAPVASALQDILRPSRCDVSDEWGLLPHQVEGYRWLMARAESGLGAVLADSMGLGKTRQAIAWMLGVRASLLAKLSGASGCSPVARGPMLVLAPAMLVRGDSSLWIKELREASSLFRTPVKVWQCIAERSCDLQTTVTVGDWRGPMVELYDVVITSYETALAHRDQFCAQDWTCVVCDEAQAIKRHAAQISGVVKKLAKAPYRLALTGSPVENSLDDLHSILEFVQPDCAGSLKDFRQRFPGGAAAKDALGRLLQAIVLRREPGGLVEMVPKEELDVPVGLAQVQRELYAAAPLGGSPMRRFRSLELLCSHPWCMAELASKEVRDSMPERFLRQAGEQRVEDSGKTQELFKVLRGLLALGEKVVVFVCRTVTSKLLSALIARELGDRAGIIRGDTDLQERERVLRAFRAEPTPGVPPMQVLLLSVWVGAVGLNLPEARWVVHFERVWNPARERQATSRAHRLTSTRPVKAYCLYSEGTVEEYKRDVLTKKIELSSHVIKALDACAEALESSCEASGAEEDEEAAAPSEVRELVAGATRRGAAEAAAAEAGEEVQSEDEPAEGAQNSGGESSEKGEEESEEDASKEEEPSTQDLAPHPSFSRLRPRRLKLPYVGKYGDPCDQELWHWYCDEGHREVHPRAVARSTAGARPEGCQPQRPQHKPPPLASRPCRLHDPKERRDVEVSLRLGGFACRLFIPEGLQHHFEGLPCGSQLKIRPPHPGVAPFPIFTPSSGRSASDATVGLLDLSASMVDEDGKELDYLQIVAVKPSEVEKYRASAPFFVVLELPSSPTVQHPSYGALTPEELGVGCARHWLLKLADAIGAPFVFMLDDSVASWRGVTLAKDPCSLFGRTPSNKVQFSRLSLGQLLRHHAEPRFLAEELPKFSLVGFARYRPEMHHWRVAHRRSHVYSAFVVNVHRVLHQQQLNFRQDLFIWEDIQLNLDAADVCKCYRFAMIKRRFHSGGCSRHVAHSDNPVVICAAFKKLSPESIVAEAIGGGAGQEPGSAGDAAKGAQEEQKRGRKRGRPRNDCSSTAAPRAAAAAAAAASAAAEAAELLRLEDHPALQAKGAVCDEEGNLVGKYYRALSQPFRDREGAMALVRPGLRDGEAPPEGVKLWDDTRRKSNRYAGLQDVHGAGWIAHCPYKRETARSSSRWFNVKVWGSWRFAFLLARLQRMLWEERAPPSVQAEAVAEPEAEAEAAGSGQEGDEAEPEGADNSAAAIASTPPPAQKRGRGRPKGSGSTKKASPAAGPKDLFRYFSAASHAEKAEKCQGDAAASGTVQAGLNRYFARPIKTEVL